MTITYQECKDSFGNVSTTCVKRSDGWFIPITDPNNKDYQEYLKWLAEGNTPRPAEG